MTNEEINALNDKAEMEYEMIKDKCHDLYDENKQLKERFERLVQEHIDTITRNEEKQQRIDKATEYINNGLNAFEKIKDKDLITNRMVDIECFKDLLQILGGNNENLI